MAKMMRELEITPKLIRLGTEFYPMRNVTQFGSLKLRTKRAPWILLGVLCLGGGGVALTESPAGLIGLLVGLVLLSVAVFKKPRYALYIETAAGSAELFSSTDQDAINSIVVAIQDAHLADNDNVSYTFHIAGDVIQGNTAPVVNHSAHARVNATPA